ncbi:MAG: deoxynucleoside kinase [Bacteroidota bacterium]
MTPVGMRNPFVVIEWNIGAGKTTLSTMLSQELSRRLILEEFTDNPFLANFYDNPERYAFPVELFFMTERHKQLQMELSQPQFFEQGIISDYIFIKTLLFARNNLKEDEFRLFQRLFHILKTNFPRPDLVLYLHQSIEGLQANIRKRGRSYEQQMDPAYLLQIQNAYFDYFRTVTDIPILILDVEQLDFVRQPAHFAAIRTLIGQPHPAGMQQIPGEELLVIR